MPAQVTPKVKKIKVCDHKESYMGAQILRFHCSAAHEVVAPTNLEGTSLRGVNKLRHVAQGGTIRTIVLHPHNLQITSGIKGPMHWNRGLLANCDVERVN